jgi:hypothetical protein
MPILGRSRSITSDIGMRRSSVLVQHIMNTAHGSILERAMIKVRLPFLVSKIDTYMVGLLKIEPCSLLRSGSASPYVIAHPSALMQINWGSTAPVQK